MRVIQAIRQAQQGGQLADNVAVRGRQRTETGLVEPGQRPPVIAGHRAHHQAQARAPPQVR